MPVSTTPTVIRRYVALELRRLREEKGGINQTTAGEHIGSRSPQSVIAKFEKGDRMPKLGDVRLLLDLYDRPELFDQFRDLMTHTTAPGPAFDLDNVVNLPENFDMYLGLEQGASTIFTYDAMIVKGILQCRAYAEALLRGHQPGLSDSQVTVRLDLRMRRQEALDRADPQVELIAVIDESVLRREIGGRVVLAEQLDHLLTAANRPNVSIRVLPYSVGVHPALHGPFTLLDFPIKRDPGVVYLEDRIGGRYRDDIPDIDEYRSVAETLLELAMSEKPSVTLIKKVRREIGT
jgi:hypothetical protein